MRGENNINNEEDLNVDINQIYNTEIPKYLELLCDAETSLENDGYEIPISRKQIFN